MSAVVHIGVAGPADLVPLLPHLDVDPQTVPAGLGGTAVTQLVLALLGRGLRVGLATLDFDVESPQVFRGPLLTVRVGPYRRHGRMRDLMAAERRAVRDMIRAESPEVVSAHWCYEYALGALDAGPPVVVTCHDWAPAILATAPDAYRLGRLLMYAATLWRARDFTVLSPYLASRLALFGRTAPVIPAGFEPAAFAAAPRLRPEGPPVLLAVNLGFGRRKNVASLLAGFPAIRAAFPDARLRLIGYGYEPGGDAWRWAARAGLNEAVDFLGKLPHAEVLRHMDAATLFVHPAREEALGLVVVEAMARGLPVIAARGAAGPAWAMGDGGLLVARPTPEALAGAATRMLGDGAAWEAASAAGLAEARARFSMPALIDDYLSCLTTAYTRGGGGR